MKIVHVNGTRYRLAYSTYKKGVYADHEIEFDINNFAYLNASTNEMLIVDDDLAFISDIDAVDTIYIKHELIKLLTEHAIYFEYEEQVGIFIDCLDFLYVPSKIVYGVCGPAFMAVGEYTEGNLALLKFKSPYGYAIVNKPTYIMVHKKIKEWK